MTTFTYRALSPRGEASHGTLAAESRAAAIAELATRGLHPLQLTEEQAVAQRRAQATGRQGRVSQRNIESFTRELANLLSAGVPLARALNLLRREAASPGARYLWGQIHDDVVGGTALGDALAKWPRSFSKVYIAMVRAGEAGGFLDVVLLQIADFRTREQDLKGKVTAALIYPCVLAVLACGVLTFLLVGFIPQFASMFAEQQASLPFLTTMIIGLSAWVSSKYGLILLAAVVALVVLFFRIKATDTGKRTIERAILKSPMLGRVVAHFALVRFCRMLGTLIGAGVSLITALRTAKEAIGNQTLADTVERAIVEVQRGSPLAKSLAMSPLLFPAGVVEMVAVAEETGRLDKELIRLSISYEAELDRRLRMLVALVEPLLLFLMAAIVGTIVIGMLLPIFNLGELMK